MSTAVRSPPPRRRSTRSTRPSSRAGRRRSPSRSSRSSRSRSPCSRRRTATRTFRLSTQSDVIQLPEITVPTMPTLWIVIVLLALATAYSALLVSSQAPRAALAHRRVRGPVHVRLPHLGRLRRGDPRDRPALRLAEPRVPLIFGSLGGRARRARRRRSTSRSRASCSPAPSPRRSSRRSPASPGSACIAAMVAGMLVGMVLAAFSIKYFVDQVIVGVVLNVLVIGLTSFFYSQVLAPNAAALNTPPRFERLPIPLLSEIPIIGPVLFRQTIVVYLMYVAVAARLLRPLPHQVGPAPPRRRRAPAGRRHRRHQGEPHPVLERRARRRHRRPRRHVLHASAPASPSTRR